MSKPTHRAYIVVEPKEGSDRKAKWVLVGAVWPHKNGNGFDVVIPSGCPVSGRIVCTQPKAKTAEFEASIQEQIREMSSH
jgi:hypothetical protein